MICQMFWPFRFRLHQVSSNLLERQHHFLRRSFNGHVTKGNLSNHFRLDHFNEQKIKRHLSLTVISHTVTCQSTLGMTVLVNINLFLLILVGWFLKFNLLADWFAQKNLIWHRDIYNVYYYWHDSGTYNYCLHNSPPIWRCTFIALQADRRALQAQSSIHIEGWP